MGDPRRPLGCCACLGRKRVSSDCTGGTSSRFNGKIDLAQIDLGDHSHDHLIDMQDVIRVAMARQ